MIAVVFHDRLLPRRAERVKPLSDEPDLPPEPKTERIAKALAHIGIASRREAERLIEAGRISVNGEILKSPAVKVGPDDEIALDGQPVGARPPTRLWRHHKPEGLLTTHKDPEGRETVFERLPGDMGRVISVGRLDLNSEGLLLLTNDGALARVLELPATGWTRRYRVRAYGSADDAALEALKDGVTVEGVSYGPIDVVVDRRTGANVWLSVGLKEGKNREVRKVLSHVGLAVNRLVRVAYGPFQLGALKSGEVEEVRPAVLREQLGRLYPLDAKSYPSDTVAPTPVGRAKARPRPERPGGQDGGSKSGSGKSAAPKAGWAKPTKKSEPGHKVRKRAEKAERDKAGKSATRPQGAPRDANRRRRP